MQNTETLLKSTENAEPAKLKKKPVLFSKEYLEKSPHARWLNSTIRSNRRGKDNNLLMTYQKANGEVVERRIKPLSANRHLLLAHDYNRNNVRTFHVERIQKMEKSAAESQMKSAFEIGFEKRAMAPHTLESIAWAGFGGAVIGAQLGILGIGMLGGYRSGVMDKAMKAAPKKKVEEYAELMKQYPDLKLHGYSEIMKNKNEAKLRDDKEYYEAIADGLGDGSNASFFRIPGVSAPATQMVLVPDMVNESVLGHEIGHYLTKKYMMEASKKERERIEGSVYNEEVEAWKRSPLPVDPKLRDAALGTYATYKPSTAAAFLGGGALLGAGAGAILASGILNKGRFF